jgi:hypothetical protein
LLLRLLKRSRRNLVLRKHGRGDLRKHGQQDGRKPPPPRLRDPILVHLEPDRKVFPGAERNEPASACPSARA